MEKFDRRSFFVQLIVLGHDIANLFHDAIQLQRHPNGLRNIACILDAHSKQLRNLVEPPLVSWADLFITSFVNELDNAVWLAILRCLAWYRVAIYRSDHEILDIPDLRLVVNLVDEACLLLSIVADDEVAREEHLA